MDQAKEAFPAADSMAQTDLNGPAFKAEQEPLKDHASPIEVWSRKNLV